MTNVALNGGFLAAFAFGRAVATAAGNGRFAPVPFLKKPLRAPEKEALLSLPGFLQSAALWPIPLHLKQRVLASSSFLDILFPLPGTLFPLASRPRFGPAFLVRCWGRP